MLRLPTIRDQFAEIADAAEREQMTYRGFLAELLHGRVRRPRPAAAPNAGSRPPGSPATNGWRDFDFDANPNIDPATIHTLATCDWVQQGPAAVPDRRLRHRQVPPAHRAGHRRRRGRATGSSYTLATKLVNELVEAADDKTAGQDHRPLRPRRPALHRRARLHGTRPPRRRTALPGPDRARGEELASPSPPTSPSRGWTKTFTDPRLCAAIVDRLTFGGNIIETGTDSYRLAQATKQRTT